jgi:hypothetical protein
MEWNEQLAKARSNGLEYATNGIAGGEKSPSESPLSGEWAGAVTPRDVVNMACGIDAFEIAEEWAVTELCDAWEDGYYSAQWPEPAGELCGHGLSAWLCAGPNHYPTDPQ